MGKRARSGGKGYNVLEMFVTRLAGKLLFLGNDIFVESITCTCTLAYMVLDGGWFLHPCIGMSVQQFQ